MALCASDIVTGDKLVIMEFADRKPLNVVAPRNLTFMIIVRNDMVNKVIFATEGSNDKEVSYPYDELGIPATPSGEWSSKCVLRLGIAKNVMNAHTTNPEWSEPPGHLNRGFMANRTPDNGWYFPDGAPIPAMA